MIVFICIFAALTLVLSRLCIEVFKKNQTCGTVSFVVLIPAIFLLVTVLLSSSRGIVRDDAALAAYYNNQAIYFDEDNRSYFVIDVDSLWNPLLLHERTYLETETVEKYIELIDQIDELDVLGKESGQ